MEIEIIEERENVFFKRKDVKVLLKHEKAPTPSKEEVKKLLAEKYGVDVEQVHIDYIFGRTGKAESIAKVKILKEKPVKEEVKNEAQDNSSGKNIEQ